MKKLLSILLSSVMLFGAITSAGVLTAGAVEDNTVNENIVEDTTVEETTIDDSDSDDNAVGDSDVIYSVIGNSEILFFNTDDIYDTTTEMTYDSNVGLYKFMFYDVEPETDIRIKIVKNHSINEEFDIQSTYFIFDVVSTCDVLVTFDDKTGITNVLGEGVVPFNVRDVILIGNGGSSFTINNQSGEYRLTETEEGVWEITIDKVMTSTDRYCRVFFAVNPFDKSKLSFGYGFGNAENKLAESGVEADAAILNSRDIMFKVDEDNSTVHLKLDLRNFDCTTKLGAKFTVTVTPPEEDPEMTTEPTIEEDVYTVQLLNDGFFGGGNDEVPMSYNDDSGLYELFVRDIQPQSASIYILKNHSERFGAGDEPYQFDVGEACDVTITFDPLTGEINVTGDGIYQETGVSAFSVIAVGNGEESYLNGANWDPGDTSNLMKEVSDGIWEMTMTDIYAFDNYNIMFVVNSIDEYGNPTDDPWRYSFGVAEQREYPTGQEIDAVFGGQSSKSCVFTVPQDGSTVKLRFDIRRFDFATKKGAKFTITVTPPSPYGVQIVNTGFYPGLSEVPMKYFEENGLYVLTAENVPPQTVEFYILKDHQIAYGHPDLGKRFPYVFEVRETCDVMITFDPITEEISVVGDGVFPEPELNIYSVIAVGNGEDTYLNGVNWDPCDTSNSMQEVSDGIWEMTMTDIYAFDNYNIKFAVNSIDEDGNPINNPWMHTYGVEVEKEYPTGQEIEAVYGGQNCIFTVPQDGSTVKLRLDFRNYIHGKIPAKLTIIVTPPGEPSPTLAGDVNGDNVVDILDAVMVQKFSADKTEFNQAQLAVADFNGDGNIDILDAAAIQKHAAAA